MAVLFRVLFTIVAVPGLLLCAVQVPVPTAAMVADPPGSAAQLTVWSGPASVGPFTVIATVSAQPPLVQIY